MAMIVRVFLLASALIAGTPVLATDAEAIRTAVDAYLTQYRQTLLAEQTADARIDYQISPLDPRLSLADCPAPLQTEARDNSRGGRVNVKVSCTTGSPWTLYVPADINIYRPVLVLAGPVPKGTVLGSGHLVLQERNINSLDGGYFSDMAEVAGMVAKRPLLPGQPLLASQLEPPLLVRKGDAVNVTANSGGLTIKAAGIALADGRAGEQIRVRNRTSNRIVDARVAGPGQVEVAM